MHALWVTLALSTIGCSGRAGETSCQRVCSLNNACTGAQQQDCVNFCAETEAVTMASACDAAYAAYLTCKDGHANEACDPTGCTVALADYFDCVSAFCSQSPTATTCQ